MDKPEHERDKLETFYRTLDMRIVNQLSIKVEKKHKRIFSALHGYTSLTPNELTIVDSCFLQRLRNIAHLGLAYQVFPESKHSRFDHSIGTLHIAKEVVKSFSEKGIDDEIINHNIPMAALLHDCGHFPFSHVTERALLLDHEHRGANIILGRDEKINNIWKELTGENSYTQIFDFLTEHEYSPELISHWISLDHIPIETEALKPYEYFSLISGVIDVDKLDYLTRDSFFTGTPYGSVDLKRIIRSYTVLEKNGKKLGIEERDIESVVHFLIGGEMDYDAIACHHTTRIVESMLSSALLLTTEILDKTELRTFIEYLGLMEDSDLLYALEIVAQEKGSDLINELVQRIRFRRLYKSIQIKSFDKDVSKSMRKMCDSLSELKLEKKYEVPQRLQLFLRKSELTDADLSENFKWDFDSELIIIDFKDMPALPESYVQYTLKKMDGKERKQPLYVVNAGPPRPLTDISVAEINPQDILSRYIRFAASILCMSLAGDRDDGKLDIFRRDDFSYLCTFIKLAVKKRIKINEKIRELEITI